MLFSQNLWISCSHKQVVFDFISVQVWKREHELGKTLNCLLTNFFKQGLGWTVFEFFPMIPPVFLPASCLPLFFELVKKMGWFTLVQSNRSAKRHSFADITNWPTKFIYHWNSAVIHKFPNAYRATSTPKPTFALQLDGSICHQKEKLLRALTQFAKGQNPKAKTFFI